MGTRLLADTITAQSFRMLNLPPELWSKIGEYAIDTAPKVNVWPRNMDELSILDQPPITRTCNALRSELLSYFYGTKIHLRLWPSLVSAIVDWRPRRHTWLEAIGSHNRCLLKNIELQATLEEKEDVVVQMCETWDVGFVVGPGWLADEGRWLDEGCVKGELMHRVFFR